MKYNVTVLVPELDVREGPYLVEAPTVGLARTRAMGEYLNGTPHPKLSGASVDYDVAPVGQPLFTGDWEHNDTLTAWEVAYTAVSYGEPWNGWTTPVVSRRVLAALVARNEFRRATDLPELDRWEWVDQNTVRVVPFDGDPVADATLLEPGTYGHYDLSVLGYTWVTVDEDDNVVRTVKP